MDLYLLNSDLTRDIIIDRFDSLVWTERFSDLGDFKLELPANTRWRTRLLPGRMLSYANSKRVMVIRTTEDTLEESGERKFRVSGDSLESVLQRRVAMHHTNPTWKMEDIPGKIVRRMVDDICRVGTVDLKDRIPGLVLGTLFPPDTILEPFQEITIEIDAENLYDFTKNICAAYDLGFRLCKNPNNEALVFEVYAGRDLTSRAPIDEPVIFSPALGNLNSSSLIKSDLYYRTVVVVVSAQGKLWVNRGDGTENANGLKRSVALVKNTEITAEWPSSRAQLQMLVDGRGALANSRRVLGFDGEISKVDSYEYGVHYELGDVVELRSDNGEESHMRVTEQILVSDVSGERSYPTLTFLETATPGTWLSAAGDKTWSEMTTETWATADSLGG